MGGLVVGTGVVTIWGDGDVHPLMQSIRMRASAASPKARILIRGDMKFRYLSPVDK